MDVSIGKISHPCISLFVYGSITVKEFPFRIIKIRTLVSWNGIVFTSVISVKASNKLVRDTL